MNMKKWSAGVMAAAMAFSLALPAGAAADRRLPIMTERKNPDMRLLMQEIILTTAIPLSTMAPAARHVRG